MSPASGADLTVRNISKAPVVFSVCGAPEQVRHEVLVPALTPTLNSLEQYRPIALIAPNPCLRPSMRLPP